MTYYPHSLPPSTSLIEAELDQMARWSWGDLPRPTVEDLRGLALAHGMEFVRQLHAAVEFLRHARVDRHERLPTAVEMYRSLYGDVEHDPGTLIIGRDVPAHLHLGGAKP